MDRTETYIKMCEKAWPELKEHNILFSRNLRMLYVLDGKVVLWRDEINTSNSDKAFPLWEQDQLQEMVKNIECTITYHTEPSIHWELGFYELAFDTAEQLWLAFVMKEKFGKVWNEGDWRK